MVRGYLSKNGKTGKERGLMNKLAQYKITECTCEKCISYCKKRPGWFRPKEIPKLAKFLKMSIKGVFQKYLIADYWIGNSSDTYLLSPVKDFEKVEEPLIKETISFQREHNKLMGREDCDRAGSYTSWSYAFLHAPCIFLKNNRCTIYEARPFECAVSWHGDKGSIRDIRRLIAEKWKKSKLVKELLRSL